MAVRRYGARPKPNSSGRSSITPGGSMQSVGFPEGMASSPMPASHYSPKRLRKALRHSTNY